MTRRAKNGATAARRPATNSRTVHRVVAGVAGAAALPAIVAATALTLVAATDLLASMGTRLPVEVSQPLPIMTTVACVEENDEGAFHLTNATEPEAVADRLPPQPEPSAALGAGRIRLIGTLDEFGIVSHVGHKVWAKGLLIEDETERRLNLVSITHLSAACE